jgi:hypothetical protein
MIIVVGNTMGFWKRMIGNFSLKIIKTRANAQIALLKLHSLGSKVKEVVNALEKTETKCYFVEKKQ